MTNLQKISLDIDEKVYNYAQIYSSLVEDEYQRKRSYASLVGLYAFLNLAEKSGKNVQKSMTLFRTPFINEKYEISDLYINNWHLDVRVMTEGNSFLVPKIHFDCHIVPDFYVVIMVDKNLQTAELIGFQDTSNMEKSYCDDKYYNASTANLINYAQFLERVSTEKVCDYKQEEHDFVQEKFIAFMDDTIGPGAKGAILKHLFSCPECRREFCCFTGFEMVCKQMQNYPDLMEDNSLGIVGAIDADKDIYKDKEEIIDISLKEENDDEPEQKIEENQEKQKDEPEVEETVSDILSELFSVGDEILDYDNAEDSKENENTQQKEPYYMNSNYAPENEADTPFVDDIIEIDEVTEEGIKLIEENDTSTKIPEKKDTKLLIADDILEEHPIENLEVLKDIEDYNKEGVQQVVTDFDENGKPVYSYVENVKQEDVETIDSDGEIVEETIIDNEENETSLDDETSKIQNNETISTENIEGKEENQEPVSDSDINDLFEDDEENKDEQTTNTEEQDSSETVIYHSDDDEDVTATESEAENSEEYSSKEYTENNGEESDEDYEENYDDDDDDEEDDDEYDDEDDFGINSNETSGQNKLWAMVLSILLLIVIVGGSWFFVNRDNIVNRNNIIVANNNEETQTRDFLSDKSDADSQNQADIENMQSENTQEMNDENQAEGEKTVAQEPEKSVEDLFGSQVEQEPKVSEQPTKEGEDNTLTESDLLKVKPAPANGDVNKVMANALSDEVRVELRGINWQCSSELYTNKEFNSYLKNLDAVLKMNIKQNILNATEQPGNDAVTVKLAVDNDGNLKNMMIDSTSGSSQIDDIVLQSIKETFNTEKAQIINSGTDKADTYYLKVVIKI